jgi:cytidine deaminase
MKMLSNNQKITYSLDDQECEALFKSATEAKANVYPQGSRGFAVAIMTTKGTIYHGVSYKSDTLTLTMHSEATALANAAIHGETEIVAITGPNCHICKQLIYESSLRSGIDTVILIEEAGDIKQIPISTLMPYAWPEQAKENL